MKIVSLQDEKCHNCGRKYSEHRAGLCCKNIIYCPGSMGGGVFTSIRDTEEYKAGWQAGVEAAAAIAADYNADTTHGYRLDDCILGKLNATKRKRPRKNTKALKLPKPKGRK